MITTKETGTAVIEEMENGKHPALTRIGWGYAHLLYKAIYDDGGQERAKDAAAALDALYAVGATEQAMGYFADLVCKYEIPVPKGFLRVAISPTATQTFLLTLKTVLHYLILKNGEEDL